jgi:hypothetical protein
MSARNIKRLILPMVQQHHLVGFFYGSGKLLNLDLHLNYDLFPHTLRMLHMELLKENNLGSISSIVNPLSGQENLDEKVIDSSRFLNFFGSVSFSYSTTNKST